MARRKTEDTDSGEDADLMAVVEATDPNATDASPSPPTVEPDKQAGTVQDAKVEAAVATPPAAPAGRGMGAFVGMVLGGIVAAGAGFGLARMMPEFLASGAPTDLEAKVASQAEDIAALKQELAARPDLEDLVARLAALEAAPTPASAAEIETKLTALQAALDEMESRPQPSADGADPALAAEVSALREQVSKLASGGTVPADVIAAADAAEARLKETEARAAALAEEAAAAAAAARRVAALDRVAAALDSGAPYASALADLGADVPAVLTQNASIGLPTVADLAEGFPEVARQSLEDALRANMGESWTDRVANFLRSQTGLRSLSPKEGTDPDAVLSRAEAALRAGDVAKAISELDAMPEAGKPALTDWLKQAALRVEAEAAIASLAQN